MKTTLLLFIAILAGIPVFSQNKETRDGSSPEEKPMEREKYFRDMRKFSDGSLPELWQQYTASRENSLNTVSSVPAANWLNLGPDGMDSTTGRITCHVFNPFNTQSIYIGASSGGIWKSTDGGENWQVLSDDLPSLRISAIAVNPQDTNHLLAGTGFYMANSFTTLPGIGLLESFDGGQTWSQNTFNFPYASGVSVNRVCWDPQNTGNVYIAATNGLWISRDTAQSWTSPFSGLVSDLDMADSSPHTLFASIHSGGIYKSTDSADTWVQLTSGLPAPSQTHRIALDICDSFPQFLVASIINPVNWSVTGVYKTSDGGNTWTLMPGTPNFTGVTPTVHLGWYVNLVAISPTDTNTIFLGSGKLFRTVDGGSSWSEKDYYPFLATNGPYTGIVHPDIWDLGFQPGTSSVIYCFNDGGVNKSYDDGNFWHKKNRNLVTAQIYQFSSCAADTTKIIAGLQDNGLQYLDNTGGNKSWARWAYGDGGAVAYDPVNVTKVYGDHPYGDHRRNSSVTSGPQFTYAFNAGITGANSYPFHFALIHHPTLPDHLYTANDTRIFKTTNGLIWNTVAMIPEVKTIAVSAHTPSTVYAMSWNFNNSITGFYVSYDDGATWTQAASSPGWRVTDLEADPNNYGTVYATRNDWLPGMPHVYKSTDHGNSWTAAGTGLPDVSTNAVTVNPFNSAVVYVATDLGVYISEDGGASWSDYNDNVPPYYVMDMHYHRMDSTLRIATLGRGVWKTKSVPSSFTGVDETGTVTASARAYPNPFTAGITIDLDVPQSAYVEISVLNTLGQKVKTLHSDFVPQGKSGFSWDGRNTIGKTVSPGIYFIEVKSGATKRILKVNKI